MKRDAGQRRRKSREWKATNSTNRAAISFSFRFKWSRNSLQKALSSFPFNPAIQISEFHAHTADDSEGGERGFPEKIKGGGSRRPVSLLLAAAAALLSLSLSFHGWLDLFWCCSGWWREREERGGKKDALCVVSPVREEGDPSVGRRMLEHKERSNYAVRVITTTTLAFPSY